MRTHQHVREFVSTVRTDTCTENGSLEWWGMRTQEDAPRIVARVSTRTRTSLATHTVGLLVAFQALNMLSAHEYEAQGVARTTIMETTNQVEIPFLVSVRGCQWFIRTVPSNSTADYFETGSDGTNIYTLRNLRTVVEKTLQR